MSIRKKMIDQKTDPVIVAIASGYTMNTKPGPETANKCDNMTSRSATTCLLTTLRNFKGRETYLS